LDGFSKEEITMDISVITSIFNEEKNLPLLHKRLTKVLRDMGKEYEIIAVNDGSKDKSWEVMKEIHKKDKRFKIINFRRNFGLTAGLSAGFDHAQGKIVVSMDADLENLPEDIPLLIKKLKEGNYDMVSGWRRDRWKGGLKETLLRKFTSETANKLIRKVSGVDVHDSGCTLKVYTKDVAKGIKLYGQMERFLPALAYQYGAKVGEMPVKFEPRKYGKSSVGISRTFRVFLDLILVKFLLGYSNRPIHMFGSIGVFSGFLGGIILLYLSYLRLILGQSIGGRPLLLLGILLVVLSAQFIMMGILGEVSMRTYYESQDKKTYVIREKRM